MINTLNPGTNPNAKDQNGKATALMGHLWSTSGIILINASMVDAGTKAQKGSGPRHQIGDTSDSPGNSAPQRYGRPERAGRQRQQMKSPNYFKLCIAQYILEAIIDPDGIGLAGAEYITIYPSPVDVIGEATTGSTLMDKASAADAFLAELTSEVDVICEYVATIDNQIVLATTVEELTAILSVLTEAQDYLDSINEELFTYVGDLETYINTSYTRLGKKIVDAINKVRQDVNEKNSKYWIQWPTANQSIASQFDGSDSYNLYSNEIDE